MPTRGLKPSRPRERREPSSLSHATATLQANTPAYPLPSADEARFPFNQRLGGNDYLVLHNNRFQGNGVTSAGSSNRIEGNGSVAVPADDLLAVKKVPLCRADVAGIQGNRHLSRL